MATLAAALSATEFENKRALFAMAARALGSPGELRRWYVPGRIEVLGKHTDYAGGRSLLCATERGMCVVARPRSDTWVHVADALRGQRTEFPLRSNLKAVSGWENYVGTVVRRVARNFPSASRGVDIGIASDLPPCAGLSSSSVLVVAIFTALADANRLQQEEDFMRLLSAPEPLAEYLGCIENGQSYQSLQGDRGVGTFGGSEDHTAILCCQERHLSRYSFCPVKLEQHVSMPAEWVFAVGSSGVQSNKTGSARDLYNRASHAAAAVLAHWRAFSGNNEPSLGKAVQRCSTSPEHIREALTAYRGEDFSVQELQLRFDQFLVESEVLVPAAAAALAAGDMRAFGDVVERSQIAAEQLLGNQVEQTIALVRGARELGACAASAFGAGFGGSVWALIMRSDADRFLGAWSVQYKAKFPALAGHSEFFLTGAGPHLQAI